MVINQEDSGTVQRFDTGPTKSSSTGSGDRPAFMQYFDKQESSGGKSLESSGSGGRRRDGLPPEEAWKYIKNITETDFSFLRQLSLNELKERYAALDPMMEEEIDALRKRYQTKRQPILDAIDAKKKRQQNF